MKTLNICGENEIIFHPMKALHCKNNLKEQMLDPREI